MSAKHLSMPTISAGHRFYCNPTRGRKSDMSFADYCERFGTNWPDTAPVSNDNEPDEATALAAKALGLDPSILMALRAMQGTTETAVAPAQAVETNVPKKFVPRPQLADKPATPNRLALLNAAGVLGEILTNAAAQALIDEHGYENLRNRAGW